MKIIWTISDNGDGTATLTGYDKTGADPVGEVTLPTKISYRTITKFSGNLGGKITKLIIPGTIKVVESGGSDNLQELVLQNGVEEIGYEAFWYSKKLTKVEMPKTLKKLVLMHLHTVKN